MALDGHHEEFIIINNVVLTGVQSVNFEQSTSEAPIPVIGRPQRSVYLQGPPTVTAQIDKFLAEKDYVLNVNSGLLPLLPNTQETVAASGQFIYGDNVLDFNSGILKGYAVNFVIGEPPTISFDFEIFGGLTGTGTSRLSSALPSSELSFVNTNSLVIEHDKGYANNVQSFSFSETLEYTTEYSLGKTVPEISYLGTINQQATITFDVEDYTLDNTFRFLSESTKKRDISIIASNELPSSGTHTFDLESGYLVSENLSAGVGNTTQATATYNGFRNLFTERPTFFIAVRLDGVSSSSFSNSKVKNVKIENSPDGTSYSVFNTIDSSTALSNDDQVFNQFRWNKALAQDDHYGTLRVPSTLTTAVITVTIEHSTSLTMGDPFSDSGGSPNTDVKYGIDGVGFLAGAVLGLGTSRVGSKNNTFISLAVNLETLESISSHTLEFIFDLKGA